jgi:hypothetical protein
MCKEAHWESDEKPTAADIAKMFGRGEGSIIARLAHVGLYGSRDDARTANALRVKAKAE